jgi:hypothetical protein
MPMSASTVSSQKLAFPMAGAMSALRALSGYRAERCKCLLLTANQAFKRWVRKSKPSSFEVHGHLAYLLSDRIDHQHRPSRAACT